MDSRLGRGQLDAVVPGEVMAAWSLVDPLQVGGPGVKQSSAGHLHSMLQKLAAFRAACEPHRDSLATIALDVVPDHR